MKKLSCRPGGVRNTGKTSMDVFLLMVYRLYRSIFLRYFLKNFLKIFDFINKDFLKFDAIYIFLINFFLI